MRLVVSKAAGRLFVLTAYTVATLAAFAVAAPLWKSHPILVAAIANLTATVVVFAFSMLLDNSSVYDPYWSVSPPLVVGYWAAWGASTGGLGLRQTIVIGLVLLWAVRLTDNWVGRWGGPADEDFRYRVIRSKTGRAYWPASFVSIHLMPTIWVFMGLLPLYPALTLAVPFGIVDGIAAAVAAIAIAIETLGDGQLRRFVKSPHEPHDVVKAGLWARCRHPNYLGEVLFWWGLFLFGVNVQPDWAWTAAGPLSITLLFVFISVPWMDQHMLARHGGWAAHAGRLPALLPLGPRLRPVGPGKVPLTRRWRAVGAILMVATVVVGGLLALRHQHSCVWNGRRYYSGDGLGRLDGCNPHWCENGHIMSTMMGCWAPGWQPRSKTPF